MTFKGVPNLNDTSLKNIVLTTTKKIFVGPPKVSIILSGIVRGASSLMVSSGE